MPLHPGSKVGAYEVVSLIGAGGMGEVYRAHDARLNRDVALKVLPEAFAVDASRVSRVEREAQLLASLNHSGIAAIYGVEHSNGAPVLVLELVEGVTLAEQLTAGPLAIDDALRIAHQIAIALEAAHEKGIIHRDLKPANIKVTTRGQVKVLDFGLAKMLAPETEPTPLANSPTMSLHATKAGEILGTAAYMSPEQARGRPLDRRSDVWSFGCVLYEMLVGAAPFNGATVSDLIASILKSEPDWKALPAETPGPIERLLRRCLVKDQAMRLRDIGDAQLEVAEALAAPEVERAGPLAPRPTIVRRLAWLAAALALALLTFVLTRAYVVPQPEPRPVVHSTIQWPASVAGGNPSARWGISPDGTALAFVAQSGPQPPMVWLRALDATTARPVPGTERAQTMFWSSDSRFIAFFADKQLKRIAVGGGSPFTICSCVSDTGGTWSANGVILIPHGNVIQRVADAGGTPTPVTVLDQANGETGHVHPVFLPDGRHFIFLAMRGIEPRGTFIGTLDSSERTPLVEGAANTRFARGFLVFVKGTALMAQPFDPATRVLSGDARPVVEQITLLPNGTAVFSVAQNEDVLIHGDPLASRRRHFEWRDRAGKPIRTIGDDDDYWDAQLSNDGRYLSVSAATTGSDREIYIIDAERGNRAALTDDPGTASGQVWSHDGSRIVYQSTRNGRYDLYEKTVATGQERAIFTEGAQKFVHDWSADDRYLVYTTSDAGQFDLWVLPLTGDLKPQPFQPSRASEHFPQFSPDVKWIAFHSTENDVTEVYVAPFPGPGRRIPVSRNGGTQPRWQRDGKALFYISAANRLMSVAINTAGGTLTAREPEPLFEIPAGSRWRYDVSPDGQRFLVVLPEAERVGYALLPMIMNWTELLRR
jgi:Tol biopolymer transport system component